MQVENFGKNIRFDPRQVFTPETEAEVLAILDQCHGQQIRVAGRLHSWSEAVVTSGVLLDLRRLNSVHVERRQEGIWATIGAGCQIKKALADLEQQADATLPAIGLITEQAIAGAFSTGTHGSGRQCLSHFVSELRIAVYDAESGQATIRIVTDGPGLDAARCSLGCLGVILSVGLWCRAQYRIEEHFRRYTRLEDVLAAEPNQPLQQFYLFPWSWSYFVQHRRESERPGSRLAWLYRISIHVSRNSGRLPVRGTVKVSFGIAGSTKFCSRIDGPRAIALFKEAKHEPRSSLCKGTQTPPRDGLVGSAAFAVLSGSM